MTTNEEKLKESLETRRPVLFLGAGFSLEANSGSGCPLMRGSDLAKGLYNYVIKPQKDTLVADGADAEAIEGVQSDAERGKLKEVCNFIDDYDLTDKRNEYFQKTMSSCVWDENLIPFQNLTLYPWEYIYTLNIDDLVENIYQNSKKPLEKWTRSSPHYEFPKGKTLLIKLHGDVVGEESDYVFCDDEYNQYTSKNEWMLCQFTNQYFMNDVIFIGTEFQENDIDIALKKAQEQRCSNKNNRYFFISPGKPSKKLTKRIEENSNVYHIPWTAKDFLEFIKNDFARNKAVLASLRSNGFVVWNDELEQANSSAKSTNLYFGGLPVPDDFVHKYDIPRSKEQDLVEQFIEDARYGCVSIYGDSYVGKTCFSKRILSNLVYKGYHCFYLHYTESAYVRLFESKLKDFPETDKIAVCFENAAMQYKLIRDMIKGNHFKHNNLIAITTAEYTLHEAKSYQLEEIPVCKVELKPNVDKIFAKDIYKTLKENNYLNHLEGYGGQASVECEMRRLNDFIEVLYMAHEATGFTDYFRDWINVRKSDVAYDTFRLMYVMAQVGVNYIKISDFLFFSSAVNTPNVTCGQIIRTYSRVCVQEKDGIYFHCARMLREIVEVDRELLIVWIKNLAETLGRRTVEKGKTSISDLFECLLSAKSLHKILNFEWEELKDFYDSLNQSCKHLSYYWMERGIVYRELHEHENARNAFVNAKRVHGYESYQIKHAMAKNEFEWGVYLVDDNVTAADNHFETGCHDMFEIIKDPNYKNAVHYSIHTYIDMNLDYYNKKKSIPDESQWNIWKTLFESYLSCAEADTDIKKQLSHKMRAIARKYTLDFDERHYAELIK